MERLSNGIQSLRMRRKEMRTAEESSPILSKVAHYDKFWMNCPLQAHVVLFLLNGLRFERVELCVVEDLEFWP